MSARSDLVGIFHAIETIDTLIDAYFAVGSAELDRLYAARYPLVWQAMGAAAALGYVVGVRVDPNELGWPVCCMELPGAGEVSWHMPARTIPWSGYDAKEKYARIHVFMAGQAVIQ